MIFKTECDTPLLQDGATFLPLPQSEAEVLSSTQRTNSSSASGQESVAGDTSTCSPHQGLTSTPHQGSSSLPNWAEFFPPPPACPPSDLESSANTPLIARNQHKVASLSLAQTCQLIRN